MSTRIDQYAATATGSASRPKSADANGKTAATDGSVSNVSSIDSARFTPHALQLQQMESDIGKIPVSDNKRVAAMRAAIESDSYQVDAKAVASKLARMEWDISRK